MGGGDPKDLAALARESLVVHLRSAGLDAREEDGRVWTGLDGVSCRVTVGDPIEHPGLWLVPLWFDLALDAEGTEVVRESIAGMGETPEAAAVHAAHDW